MERLNDKLVCVNQEHGSHIEWVQMKVELQRYHSMEGQRRSWELKKSLLHKLLRIAQGNRHQMKLPKNRKADTVSLS